MKQGDLNNVKLTLFLPEQNSLEIAKPLVEAPMNPEPVVQEALDNVHA